MVLTSTESIYNHAKSHGTFAYVMDQNLRNLPVILVCREEDNYKISNCVFCYQKICALFKTQKGFGKINHACVEME